MVPRTFGGRKILTKVLILSGDLRLGMMRIIDFDLFEMNKLRIIHILLEEELVIF